MTLIPGTVVTRRADPLTQAQIDRWGELVGTAAPIHSDPVYAATTPLGGVIAQGMLVLAPVHNIMLELLGAQAWYCGGSVAAKVINVSRPGDAITYEVTTQACSDNSFVGEFRCLRPDGGIVAVGLVSWRAAAAAAA
ncbi:MAG: hypothetical protein K0R89_23 [Ramlibacter sp.]|jgi:acyl dehydratase|nr:hypothetical protein [Ramlibacter sp.]